MRFFAKRILHFLSFHGLWAVFSTVMLCPSVYAAETSAYEIEMEWEPVPGATAYEIRFTRLITDGARGADLRFKTRQTQWAGPVPPGRYNMRLRVFDERGVPGAWGKAQEIQVLLPAPRLFQPAQKRIATGQEDEYELPVRWEKIPGAKSYRLEVEALAQNSDTTPFKKTWRVEDSAHEVELEVGRAYRLKVTAFNDLDEAGESPARWTSFVLLGQPLDRPQPIAPTTKIVSEVKWSDVDYAQHYQYDLLQHVKGRRWKYVEKNRKTTATKAPFKSQYPSGLYRLRVRSVGENRAPSQPGAMNFKVRGGFRSPAAVRQARLKESIEKPTHFYAIGSYLFSQVNYTGLNKEQGGQQAAFSEFSGSARAGLGYQIPAKKWGLFGIVDLGGLTIQGQNTTFASAELHGTWRDFYFGSNQFLFSGGLFYKELPEVLGNQTQGLLSINKINTLGLHAGLTYWRPLSARFGLQAKARVYPSFLGSSPNGRRIEPTLSYQFGVLGSYRWSRQILALVGYAYRLERSAYQAIPFDESGTGFAQNGDLNEAQILGHYINLAVEYSF